MKFVYYLAVLALVFCGGASLFFDADLPFDSKSIVFSISSSVMTLDMAMLAGGVILLVLGFMLGKVNN